MKRLYCLLLCLSLLLTLSACGPVPGPPDSGTTGGTVGNSFTQGTVANIFTNPPTTGESEGPPSGSFNCGPTNQIFDDVSAHFDYTGGELYLEYQVSATYDFSQCGFGPLIFLDGQLQPYKTDAEPWYSYLHLVYPEYNPEIKSPKFASVGTMGIYFTPITGKEGDALELFMTAVSDPYTDPASEDYNKYEHVQYYDRDFCARVIFYATPPELEAPEVKDRLLSHSITWVDEPKLATWTPDELKNNHVYTSDINGVARPATYALTDFDQKPMNYHFELYGGDSYVKYTLVCFLDYQPISINPDDIINVEVRNGQRTEVDVQIDMSDFDGSATFMAVLVPINYQAYEDGTIAFPDHLSCRFEKLVLCHLIGEEE